jgi:hypothetical protein
MPQQAQFDPNSSYEPASSVAGFDPNASYEPAKPPSSAAHIRDNFLSGIGVTDDEGAKNFFRHPLNTLMDSFKGQGELYQKAKDSYDRGDYKGAVIHGLNYLVPFIGQQTDKAGEQLEKGDYSGGISRTLGAAVPIVAGSPEVKSAAGSAVSTAANAAKVPLRMVSRAARTLPDSSPDIVGMWSPRAAHGLRVLQKMGKVADTIAASKTAAAASTAAVEDVAPELTTPARTLPGQNPAEITRPAAAAPAAPIPPRSGLALPPAPEGSELGDIPYTGKSAAQSGEALATKPKGIDLTKSPEAAAVVRFTKADIKAATDLLHSATSDLIDEAIPLDKHYGANLATKSRVEFYLQRGDVANAEKSLDAGAKQADADYQPFYRDPNPVPSTNEIRARVQAEAKAPKIGTRADLMDDKAVDQEWGWHLERHGWSAESEARREFIARNSTGMTKGELARNFAAGRSGTGAESAPAAAPKPADDLTPILQKSLEQARRKKAQ